MTIDPGWAIVHYYRVLSGYPAKKQGLLSHKEAVLYND